MQVKSTSEKLFFTTVRIDTVTTGAQGSGTGFFFNHQLGGLVYPFIVTNKHVINGAKKWKFTFIKKKDGEPILGDIFPVEMESEKSPNAWFSHPDRDIDIAIFPTAQLTAFTKQPYYQELFTLAIQTSNIPSAEQIEELDAIEEITFIGYPNGVWDTKNFLPVARRGATASPIAVDFEGTPRFLIDASVFGGSSGSPVFISDLGGTYAKKSGGAVAGSRFYFVGVVAGVFFRTQLNEIIPVPIPTQVRPMAEQQEMIDLGIVIKACTVVETIEEFLKTVPHPPAPSESHPQSPSEAK